MCTNEIEGAEKLVSDGVGELGVCLQIRLVKICVDLWIVFCENGRRACLRGQRASRAVYYSCIRPRV